MTVTSGQSPDNRNDGRHRTVLRYLREARQLLLATATFLGAAAGVVALFMNR